jgi:SAM-dependent methyltransferase
MNGVELYLLARKLTQISDETLAEDAAYRRLSLSERIVLADVLEHLGTPAGEIADRTGFPVDHVSAQVSRLADDGFLATVTEPGGPQRVVPGPRMPFRQAAPAPVDTALAAALGTEDAGQVREVVSALESLARRLGTGAVLRSTADFDASYRGTPPWEIGRPQRAFAELAEAGAIRGRVLDVGCGTGEHALMAAGLGLPALGVDTSPTAIGIAGRKARERDLKARFALHDALDLGALAEQFDTVIDSGLFHVFTDQDRLRYVESLRRAIPAGGRYFMLCFSDRQPPGFGPRRVSRNEIESAFAEGWVVDAIDPVTMVVTINPDGVRAWRAAITRT